jgi:hypothetical protein
VPVFLAPLLLPPLLPLPLLLLLLPPALPLLPPLLLLAPPPVLPLLPLPPAPLLLVPLAPPSPRPLAEPSLLPLLVAPLPLDDETPDPDPEDWVRKPPGPPLCPHAAGAAMQTTTAGIKTRDRNAMGHSGLALRRTQY